MKSAHDTNTEVKFGIEEGTLFELAVISRLGSLAKCVLRKSESERQDFHRMSLRHMELIEAGNATEDTTLPREKEFDMKLAILGDPLVGKSSLVMRQVCMCSHFLHFLHGQVSGEFSADYDPTIEEVVTDIHRMTDSGNMIVVRLLDTAGSRGAVEQRMQWLTESDAFMLVYSISDPQSSQNIPQYIEEILKVKSEYSGLCVPLPIAVVANKCDYGLDHDMSSFDTVLCVRTFKNFNHR